MSPLDTLLERLRAHRLPYEPDRRDHHLWRAVCPACRFAGYSLLIRETRGAPKLTCTTTGCSEDEIRAALAVDSLQSRVADLEAQLADALAVAEGARVVAAQALRVAEGAIRGAARESVPTLRAVA